MGKRKNDKDYDTILKKVRKLEKQLKKRKRGRSISSSSSEREDYTADYSNPDFTDSSSIVPFEDSICDPEVNILTEKQNQTENSVESPTLDPTILQLLGEDPNNQKKFGDNIHKDIAQRWTYLLTNGLEKETYKELTKIYLPPENCANMKAPILNPEVKAALTEINIKKDIYNQTKQNELSCSLAALGQVLNWALETKNQVPQNIIKLLSDTGKLICDCHYKESLSRRYSALNTLNKNMRDTVKNTKIDENLFGSGLGDHIKSTKAITRTSSELKQTTTRSSFRVQSTVQVPRNTLNSRGATRAVATDPRSAPPPVRRPPRDRRRQQDSTRGRRSTGYTRQQNRRY